MKEHMDDVLKVFSCFLLELIVQETPGTKIESLRMRLCTKKDLPNGITTGTHPGRLNLPSADSMVSYLFDVDDEERPLMRPGLTLYPRVADRLGGDPLPDFSEFINPASYPFLHPYGDVEFVNSGVRCISKQERKKGNWDQWNSLEEDRWGEQMEDGDGSDEVCLHCVTFCMSQENSETEAESAVESGSEGEEQEDEREDDDEEAEDVDSDADQDEAGPSSNGVCSTTICAMSQGRLSNLFDASDDEEEHLPVLDEEDGGVSRAELSRGAATSEPIVDVRGPDAEVCKLLGLTKHFIGKRRSSRRRG